MIGPVKMLAIRVLWFLYTVTNPVPRFFIDLMDRIVATELAGKK